MKKTFATLLAGAAFVAAMPASAGVILVEVGGPTQNPNAGGTSDTPKFRIANITPGSDTLPTISSILLTLPGGSSNTIGAISNWGQGDWAPGDDDNPPMSSVGSGQIDYGPGNKSVTINYVGGKFDPGAYSTFTLNFGPGSSEDFRTILFPGATLKATFSDGTFGEVNFSAPPSSTTQTGYTWISGSGGAVPEPATWAMMILGFGLVGGAMRSTRRQARIRFA